MLIPLVMSRNTGTNTTRLQSNPPIPRKSRKGIIKRLGASRGVFVSDGVIIPGNDRHS